MPLLERFKRFGTLQMADVLGRASANLSDEAIVRVLDLFQGMIDDDGYRRGFEDVRNLVREGHGSTGAARRLFQELSPGVREKVIDNFFVGQVFDGFKRRYAFWEEHGFGPPNAVVVSPTMRCNIRCEGCYAGGYTADEDLPYEDFERVVGEAKAMGANFVFVAGGEPFVVWPVLRQVMERHLDVDFQIYKAEQAEARLAPCMQRLGATLDQSTYRVALLKSLEQAGAARGIQLKQPDEGESLVAEPGYLLSAHAPMVRLVASGGPETLALDLVVDLRLYGAADRKLRYASLLAFGPEFRPLSPFVDRSPLYLRRVGTRPPPRAVAEWCGESGPALLAGDIEAGLQDIAAQFVGDFDRL